MALDFPIKGETKVTLSLDAQVAGQQIKRAELVSFLKEQIGQRSDNSEIIKVIEEFFILSADFLRYQTAQTLPPSYQITTANEHFLLSRETESYTFIVDNFGDNGKYFERTLFKIISKTSLSQDPAMVLFLVPQICDLK